MSSGSDIAVAVNRAEKGWHEQAQSYALIAIAKELKRYNDREEAGQ